MTPAGKRRMAAAAIGLLTAVPVGVGFVVSWGAQRDAALAAHVAPGAAKLYAVGVDGLITVALVSALVLRHERAARRYSLAVLIAFSASSLALNIAHGAGAFVPGAAPGAALTALVTAQPVAAIAFGSHLLVHVLRVWFPALAADSGPRGNAVRRAAARPAPAAVPVAATAAEQATPQTAAEVPVEAAVRTSPGAGEGVGTRHRGEQPADGTAAVLHLQRHIPTSATDAASAAVPAGAPGSKTEAILRYRAAFVAGNGREPTGKETAAATGASERMARKVLGEFRGNGTTAPVPATSTAGAADDTGGDLLSADGGHGPQGGNADRDDRGDRGDGRDGDDQAGDSGDEFEERVG